MSAEQTPDIEAAMQAEASAKTLADDLCAGSTHPRDEEAGVFHCQECYDIANTVHDSPWLARVLAAAVREALCLCCSGPSGTSALIGSPNHNTRPQPAARRARTDMGVNNSHCRDTCGRYHAFDCPNHPGARPSAPETVQVVRGWRFYPDGSRSPVERWVKHADGDWVSLDSTRRTSGDIHMEVL